MTKLCMADAQLHEFF